jgi:hypothetical protein
MPSRVTPRATASPTEQLQLLPISLQLESHPSKRLVFFHVLRTQNFRHDTACVWFPYSYSSVMKMAPISSSEMSVNIYTKLHSRDSVVSIATGYGLDDRGVGVRVPVGSRIFCSPCPPDRFWGPTSLVPNGYRGLFPRGHSSRSVRLTTHFQPVPRSRKYGSIHPLPICLHGVVLN